MTIDITNLINTPPNEFEKKLKAFQKAHPQFFKQESVELVVFEDSPQFWEDYFAYFWFDAVIPMNFLFKELSK